MVCLTCTYSSERKNAHFLKGQCHEIFCRWFFYESVSPQPQSVLLGPFRTFSKIRGDIRSSRLTSGVADTMCLSRHAIAGLNSVGRDNSIANRYIPQRRLWCDDNATRHKT
jgi:hypothetical protein